jgi:hypothetical protein
MDNDDFNSPEDFDGWDGWDDDERKPEARKIAVDDAMKRAHQIEITLLNIHLHELIEAEIFDDSYHAKAAMHEAQRIISFAAHH